MVEHEEPAGEPGDCRRDDEGEQFVRHHRIPQETGTHLVLADRDKHVAKRRVGQSQQEEAHQESLHGDEGIEQQRLIQGIAQHGTSLDAAKAVLTSRERCPSKRDRKAQGTERQREQGKIDAPSAQDERSDQDRAHRNDHRTERDGNHHRIREEPALQDRNRVCADAEPGAMTERNQPGLPQKHIQPESHDGQQNAIDRRSHGEPPGQQDKRQHDQSGQQQAERAHL